MSRCVLANRSRVSSLKLWSFPFGNDVPWGLAHPWRLRREVVSRVRKLCVEGRLGGGGGLRFHVECGLQVVWSLTEAIFCLPVPGGLDEAFGLVDHRLRLQVAVGVDLARGDRCHRGVHRLGVELCSGEGK